MKGQYVQSYIPLQGEITKESRGAQLPTEITPHTSFQSSYKAFSNYVKMTIMLGNTSLKKLREENENKEQH